MNYALEQAINVYICISLQLQSIWSITASCSTWKHPWQQVSS